MSRLNRAVAIAQHAVSVPLCADSRPLSSPCIHRSARHAFLPSSLLSSPLPSLIRLLRFVRGHARERLTFYPTLTTYAPALGTHSLSVSALVFSHLSSFFAASILLFSSSNRCFRFSPVSTVSSRPPLALVVPLTPRSRILRPSSLADRARNCKMIMIQPRPLVKQCNSVHHPSQTTDSHPNFSNSRWRASNLHRSRARGAGADDCNPL